MESKYLIIHICKLRRTHLQSPVHILLAGLSRIQRGTRQCALLCLYSLLDLTNRHFVRALFGVGDADMLRRSPNTIQSSAKWASQAANVD